MSASVKVPFGYDPFGLSYFFVGMFGVKSKVPVQTLISQATGTRSSDASGRATEWYDGLFPTGTGSFKSSAVDFFVKSDWGAGVSKTITGFKCYGVLGNPADFVGIAGGVTVTFTLYGSNDNSAFTSLGSISVTNQNSGGGQVVSKLSGLDTSTAYRYHRINSTWAGPAQTMYFDEVQFYETV